MRLQPKERVGQGQRSRWDVREYWTGGLTLRYVTRHVCAGLYPLLFTTYLEVLGEVKENDKETHDDFDLSFSIQRV